MQRMVADPARLCRDVSTPIGEWTGTSTDRWDRQAPLRLARVPSARVLLLLLALATPMRDGIIFS